jgi:hypothetical protein
MVTAFQMEALVGCHTGLSLVHDLERQFQDKDLVAPLSGKTFSVKMQNLAAKTGNFSFEVLLRSTRTQETRPGNFLACSADGYFLAWPLDTRPGAMYRIAVFAVPELHAAVERLSHRRTSLGAEAHATNAGRVFDQAESLLVRVPQLLAAASRGEFLLDPKAMLASEKYRRYCLGQAKPGLLTTAGA